MELSTIIISIVSALLGGGLLSLFTIRETKKGLAIDNKEKEDNRWSKLVDELQDQVGKLNERLERKDARITELEDRCSDLSFKLDKSNTDLAKALLLKCTKLSCSSRRPPLGYSELSPEEIIEENK